MVKDCRSQVIPIKVKGKASQSRKGDRTRMVRRDIWGDKQDRQFHYDEKIHREKLANYGFQKVHEDEKTQWVLRHFNSVAHQYDFMNTLLSFGIHYLWKREAIALLNLESGDQVLDVCGGTGDLAIMAKRQIGPIGQVTVYDINRAMIDAGRNKNTNAGIRQRIQYVQGNAELISFPSNCFDAVMVGFGIRNVTHMQQGFKEILRVLKPGGKLMCLEFSKPANRYFCKLYDFYSLKIMPFLGQVLAGSRAAYTHLPESIRMFPLPNELKSILENIGFKQVSWKRLTNGIAVIHLATK
jgi:demethylmenaquinone methyltransferase/2-methoxy-6-polyprenyl-1,4-benzoquinol methylase